MAKYRILIVDDQREIRLVLRSGLQSLLGNDVQVTDVPSGEEAILITSRQPIDLLISDVRLPGISGLELKERALVRNPVLKVILMTGMPEPRARREVERSGADAFFFKPFDLPDFMAAVQNCLGIKRALQAEPALAEPKAPLTLAERLSALHQEINALSVMLLNDNGETVAETGRLPDGEDHTTLLSALVAVFNAAMKVEYLLGAKARDLAYFNGKNTDLFLMHVGPTVGLLVAMPVSGGNDQQVTKLLASLRPAVKDIAAILDAMGVPTEVVAPPPEAQPTPEPEPEEIDISAVLPELDAIFGQKGNLQNQNLDAFWDNLSQSGSGEVNRADTISYEQAKQLGLAPEE